jgi:hypothetical protein
VASWLLRAFGAPQPLTPSPGFPRHPSRSSPVIKWQSSTLPLYHELH